MPGTKVYTYGENSFSGDTLSRKSSLIMRQGRGSEATKAKTLFITGRTSIGCQKYKTNHFSVPGMSMIQHRNWSLRSTILNAHGTNASPDGLCTRTHTNEAFSCCFCCNLCFEHQAKACSPTDQPVRKFKDGLGINMTMKTFFTLTFYIM